MRDKEDQDMAEVARIPVQEARQKATGGRALLVCAYEDEAKCDKIKLEGAISLKRFESRLPSLGRNQEIIFYCA
jgi:hypothetical protein